MTLLGHGGLLLQGDKDGHGAGLRIVGSGDLAKGGPGNGRAPVTYSLNLDRAGHGRGSDELADCADVYQDNRFAGVPDLAKVSGTFARFPTSITLTFPVGGG